ncbi:class I SAM-dependent methyltransferase [Rhodobacter sp. SY28-1]|uniref:class I SAM-dependent methyltransferase n=1 Tax=Rhodobacter sp. SY28-1 TaxID=2562317 RepID=UPI0010BF74C3|nr:class I SAM-dependent methyltransferase [Rhodobacter sp. SY28-1]
MDDPVRQPRCPICGTSAGELTTWLDIPIDVKTGQPIDTGKLVWCQSCDVGLMRRAMTPEEVRVSYDMAAYYTHGQTHFPDVAPGLADRVLVKLAWLTDRGRMMDAARLQELQPGARRVLDIGCGGGDFVASLAAPGRELFGVDPDPKARDMAAARGVTVEAGTAEVMPSAIGGQTFDLIVMTHVLEHCADPARALRNVRDLLAPGGGFYCEVPNCAALHFQTYAEISEMLDVPRHVHFFTQGSLRRLMEDAGFTVAAAVHHGHTRHFSAGWRAWENLVHRRLRAAGGARQTQRRSLGRDLGLIARSAFAGPERKYDCIGLFARTA